ncbi:MAG: sugar-binding protein, partial [Pseudomonadota bacterium]
MWFLGGEFLQTRFYQFYLKTNSIYYYRIGVTDSNEETSAWSPVVGKTVNMVLPYPPSTPAITSLVRNVTEEIWVDGVLQPGYLHEADFIVHVSTSSSGEGVSFYEIERTQNPTNFLHSENNPNVEVYMPHHPDVDSPYANAVQQFYCQSNGTYYYRVRAVDVNEFKSPWSTVYPGPFSNITVSMPEPYPPGVSQITSITNNIQNMVFSNGVLVPYTIKAHYMIHLSRSTSGAGVSVYEIQETRNPTNFAYIDQLGGIPTSWLGDTNAPVQVIAPHYPDTEYPTNDYPVYQFYLKGNGTYYYRVCAKDINGFKSDWDTAYDPANPNAYAHITVDVGDPTPPEIPALTPECIQHVEGDVILSFPDAAAGGRVNVYEIQLSTDPSFAITNEVHYSAYPNHVFSGLPEGTYYVRARTEDWNAFKSDWSIPLSFTIRWPVMTDVAVDQVSTNRAIMSWKTDVPTVSEVERRGMYRVFDAWRDPDEYVQAVNYAPGEAYGASITTNDIITDLEQLRSNNINVLNLYNLGWDELQQNGNVEKLIFDKARELGMRVVIRLEAYNKYHDNEPPGGDNVPSKHFAYREEDADWIINYYTSKARVFGPGGYAENYGDVIAYYLINLPFDDTDLIRQDGVGLSHFPDRVQQRNYVSYFYNRLKALDPNQPVFVNVFYGGLDDLPHFELADIVDGISVVAYPERVDGYYRSYMYVPGMDDPDYLLIMKDVFEYHLDKHYSINSIARLKKPMVIDQTGFCEINNAETGRVLDKRSKARAITRLARFFESNGVADFGWTYFKVHDKFDSAGEWATWGLVDRLNVYLDYFEEESDRWINAIGSWSANGGTFQSLNTGTNLSLLDLGQKKGGIEAEFNGLATGVTNLYVVTAFADANNYRYAGYDGSSARWVIGEVSNGVDAVLAMSEPHAIRIGPGTNYTLRVVVNLNAVRLDVGLQRRVVEHTFSRFLQGRVGLMTRNGSMPVNWFKMYGRVYNPMQTTDHTFVLNELYPGTEYRVRAIGGGGASVYTNFTTPPDLQAAPRPSITITRPRFGNELATGTTYVIEWRSEDPYGDALIDLFYDSAEKGVISRGQKPTDEDFMGIPIALGIAATNGSGSYTWTLSGVTQGAYYVYARIYRPSSGQPGEVDYSSGKLVLSPVQVPALRTAIPPAVDGLLAEGVWASVPATTYAVAGTSGSDASASVRLLWDDEYLYIGFDVKDPEVRSGLDIWDTDGVGCFINNGRSSLNKVDVMAREYVEYIGANSNEVNWGGTDIA